MLAQRLLVGRTGKLTSKNTNYNVSTIKRRYAASSSAEITSYAQTTPFPTVPTPYSHLLGTKVVKEVDLKKKTLNGEAVCTIFGASGFLGRYVAESMLEIGCVVVAPYRTESKSVDHLKVMGDVGQVAPIRYSLNDLQSLDVASQPANIVINMVGRAWETRNFNYDQVHVDAARAIAESSKKNGVQKFIHFSAIGADETSSSAFLRSKAKGEKAVREVLPNATILRLAPVFGFEDNILNKWGMLCGRSAKFRTLIPLEAKFQPIYCVDVADSVTAVVRNENTDGKTFELAGPEVFTVEQFINDIVLPETQTHPQITVVSHEWAKRIAYYWEYLRNPKFLQSEVDNFEYDLVANNSLPGLKDLNVRPTPVQEVCRVQLTPFKPVVRNH